MKNKDDVKVVRGWEANQQVMDSDWGSLWPVEGSLRANKGRQETRVRQGGIPPWVLPLHLHNIKRATLLNSVPFP